jgi:uncharacterized protein
VRNHRAVAPWLVTLSLVGCAVTDSTQYYTLGHPAVRSGESGTSASVASTPQSAADVRGAAGIGVGPVIIPAYLNRSHIVTRTGGDQVELSMFHRWAEPLEDGIARILADEIGARVPTERIVVFPWRGTVARGLQYQVVVAVVRFDGGAGGDVTLDARWRILGKDGGELAIRRSTTSETAKGSGYDPIVAAMSRTLAVLGQEIAAEIRTLSR